MDNTLPRYFTEAEAVAHAEATAPAIAEILAADEFAQARAEIVEFATAE